MQTPPRRNISHAGLALLACCLPGLPCIAQTQDSKPKPKPKNAKAQDLKNWDPVEKGLNPNGDLYPVKYTIDDKGRLWLSPSPSKDGSVEEKDNKELMFPDRLRDWRRVTNNLGLLGVIRFTLVGNQDLLSLTDAEYVFRKRKLGQSDLELRQRLAVAPAGDTPGRKQCAEMDRLLAVRLIQRRKVKGAQAELQLIARDAAADPFLRTAAREALATLNPEKFKTPVLRKPDIKKLLLELPIGLQLVATVDQTRVPRWPDLARLARVTGLSVTLKDIRAAGGGTTPAMLAGATKLADIVGLLPYEITRRFGNARILRTTWGLRFLDRNPQPFFFVRWDGMIPAPKLKAALEQDGYKAAATKDGAFLVDLGSSLEIVFNERQLTFRTAGFPMKDAGTEADKLLGAGFGKSPIWLHIADGASLMRQLGPMGLALPKVTRGTLSASFAKDTDADLNMRIHLPVKREATGVLRHLETLMKTVEQAAGVSAEMQLVGRVLEGFKFEEDEDDDKRLVLSWKPGDLTMASFLKMLGR